MRIAFKPGLPSGEVKAPPSKSDLHRLLIAAGLADGESGIGNVSDSDDIRATLLCLRALGARITREGRKTYVRGIRRGEPVEGSVCPCGECGSTLRFLIPVAAAHPGKVLFTGADRLFARPLSVYEDVFREQGVPFTKSAEGVWVGDGLHSGRFAFPGDVSSQFASGLLFALPLLPGKSEIRLTGPIESRPYIDMTLRALSLFGVEAGWRSHDTLSVPGGQRFTPADAEPEGDWSNAAFWFLMRALGAQLRVSGLEPDSLQGDRGVGLLLERVKAGNAVISLADCPDLGPVLMAAAAAFGGAVFTHTRRLKLKESDRGAAMAQELLKLGVPCRVEEDRVTVSAAPLRRPQEPLCGHGDHRIVMALSVLLLVTGGELTGAEAAAKSYPDFFELLKRNRAVLKTLE